MKKILFLLLVSFLLINNAYALTEEQTLNDLINNVKSLESKIDGLIETRLDKTYPIGSIYETTTYSNASEVGNALGGVWETYGAGKTLVSFDSGDSAFNVIGKTGGTNITTLTTANLPSHTHSIPALTGTAASAGAHTHTRGTMNISGSFNVRGMSSSPYDTVTWAGNVFSSSVMEWSGSHGVIPTTMANPAHYNIVNFNAANNWTGATSSNGAHTHSVTVNSDTNAKATGSNGSGTSFTNLQPYITVYMYKRIA